MTDTYCVIMCGGIGSRFWPLSTSTRPKQFLDFFGTGRTLLQMTADRVRRLVSPDRIIIMTNAAYAPLVAEQLPEIPAGNILCEPARRNTAPCICWSAHHIAARCPDAAIITLPSDHVILREDEFLNALREGVAFVHENDALLTLGIKPTMPNTGYGYIQRSTPVEGWPGVMKVKSFTEKPNAELAKFFVESGEFFWNAGIFLWRADTVLRAFADNDPETAAVFAEGTYTDPQAETVFINNAYPTSPSNSVDYAVMEKASNVFVKTADFGWSDLGTWKALHEMSPRSHDGNVTQRCKALLQDCHNSVFAVGGDKIVVAAGLDGYIVAENDKALLIYPIDREQQVKQVVNDVAEHFGKEYL